MKQHRLPLMLIVLALGCEQTPSPPPAVTTSDQPSANEALFPRFKPVEVFINNRQFGDANGCTTGFVPQPLVDNVQIKHTSTCGHPGAVSKITWEYVGTDEKGDHYRFRRVFPYKESNQESATKEIVYDGIEQILFEDEDQRILIRPESVNE